MNDLVDVFYRNIMDDIERYANRVVNTSLINKRGQIELIPINQAKGELNAIANISDSITRLYKKFKSDLNTIE